MPITAHCRNHRLSTRDRLELFIHVCDGVQHAHQKDCTATGYGQDELRAFGFFCKHLIRSLAAPTKPEHPERREGRGQFQGAGCRAG
jgi:hypothetical protein